MVYSEKQKGKNLQTSTVNPTGVLPISHFHDLVKFGEKSFSKRHSIFNVRRKFIVMGTFSQQFVVGFFF